MAEDMVVDVVWSSSVIRLSHLDHPGDRRLPLVCGWRLESLTGQMLKDHLHLQSTSLISTRLDRHGRSTGEREVQFESPRLDSRRRWLAQEAKETKEQRRPGCSC